MNLPTRRLSPPLLLPLTAATAVGVIMTALSMVVLPKETGPTPTSSADPAAVELTPLPAGEELLIASGVDQSRNRARQQAVDEWNRRHGDIRARIVEVRGDTDEQRRRFKNLLGPREPEPIDIVNLDSAHLAEFAEATTEEGQPLLAALDAKAPDIPNPITGDLLRTFLRNPLLTCYWDNTLYSLPFNSDVGLLFFQAGTTPPETAEDLPRALSANPSVPHRIAIQLSPDEAFVVNILEQLLAVNPKLLRENGTAPTIVQEEWEEALAVVRDKVKSGLLYYPDDLKADSAEAKTTLAFQNKTVAAMRNWPVWFGEIQPEPEVRRLFGPGILGGQNLAVAAKSRHKAQSIELIKFLTSAEIQQKLLLDGRFVPTTESTYTSSPAQAIPYIDQLLEAVKQARPRPITPNYYRVSSVIIDNLYPAVWGKAEIPATFERQMQDALG
ncbi:extracellular solute-binding protein [Micromonospora sp. NPDC049081]|uniref:extracellular solute-binding protein n=1 Tax=Micromonospora sp. NPDC049081 TaxID=3155150 RepID=UPI0033F46BB7